MRPGQGSVFLREHQVRRSATGAPRRFVWALIGTGIATCREFPLPGEHADRILSGSRDQALPMIG
jgi:hypothetical protein